MLRAGISLTTQFSPSISRWRAGNLARSRLSGGSCRIRTRPRKFFSRTSQPRLHRILLNIGANTLKFFATSDQAIKALLLPKRSVDAQKKIGLVSSKSLERPQPFGGEHVRRRQKMNMIGHHDKGMEFVTMECAFSVPQRRHNHLCNFRAPQEQGTIRASVQEPVDRHERLARGCESGWREYPARGKTAVQPKCDEQRLIDYVKMWQPPFIMPHTCLLCSSGRDVLRDLEGGQSWPQPAFSRLSRLKGGCGQYCPPSNAAYAAWRNAAYAAWRNAAYAARRNAA